MIRFLRSLFRRSQIVDVSQFGPRLTLEQIQVAMRNRKDDPLFRAMCQIIVFQRGMCQQAMEDKSNIGNGQMKFEAGAAASAADILKLLVSLEKGQCPDPQMRTFFADPSEKSQGK